MSDSAKLGRGELLLYKCVAVSCAVVQCVDASHGFSFFKQPSKSPLVLRRAVRKTAAYVAFTRRYERLSGCGDAVEPIIHGRMT